MSTRNRTRGFTFIEFLIVVAIMGILGSVLIGGLERASDRSRDRREAYLATLAPVPVTVQQVRHDLNADDYDEAEHWVLTNERGPLPIADSGALNTDDDAVAMKLDLLAPGHACVIIENVSYLGDAVTDVRPCP